MATQTCCLYFCEYNPKTKLCGPSLRQDLLFIGNERPAGAAAEPCMRGRATLRAGRVDRIHLPLETEEQQLVATFAHQCPTTHSEISLSAPLCLGCKLPKRWSECFFLFYFPPRRFGFTSFSFHASGRAQFLQIDQSASNVQTSQTNFCS